jgi:hypothetical protein
VSGGHGVTLTSVDIGETRPSGVIHLTA